MIFEKFLKRNAFGYMCLAKNLTKFSLFFLESFYKNVGKSTFEPCFYGLERVFAYLFLSNFKIWSFCAAVRK